MNQRQRFTAQMHYEPVDRPPHYDFNYWDETIPAWHAQGLPAHLTRRDTGAWLGFDASLGGGALPDWNTGVRCGLHPAFPREILEDRGQTVIERDHEGVIVERGKAGHMSIPMHLGHTLVDRASWREHYLPRLDPDAPDRLPTDWDRRVKVWSDPQRDHPVFLNAGSLFGWVRDWMGMENIALVVYDDPAWFEEMVTTVADLQVALLEKVLATGGQFEACTMWEDMCYNAGPLLAPQHFKRYLVPQYRRITELLHHHGVDIVWIDCDGKIDELIPLWLDAGVNTMFPLEIGTWDADPLKYRARFGRDLRMMGGFDKHILATTPQAIEAEVRRLAPLVEEGGYIPFCDHRVPPDVPLANYRNYVQAARSIWAHGASMSA